MGACASAPQADVIIDDRKKSGKKKGKAAALIKADIPGEPLVSTPEAVYLTTQPSWNPEDDAATSGSANIRSSKSFRIKAEGEP